MTVKLINFNKAIFISITAFILMNVFMKRGLYMQLFVTNVPIICQVVLQGIIFQRQTVDVILNPMVFLRTLFKTCL